MTVVVLLHKHLRPYLALSVILSAFSRTALNADITKSSITAYVYISFTFFKSATTCNFILILISFVVLFFTCIALGDGALRSHLFW